MTRSALTLLLILFSAGFLHAQTKAEQIDSLLYLAHQRGFFNGSALVAEKGSVIYQNEIGFADASRNKNLEPNLRFGIGSISKEFDGTALAILKEQGKLSLQDNLSKFFPELPDWAQKVSVQHLLQYTSGLPTTDYQSVRTDVQVWDFLRNLKDLQFRPGSKYLYNNTNVFLRKRIVEKVSGQTYTDFVAATILKPCGMSNTIFDASAKTPRIARSFDNHFVQDDLDTHMSGWIFTTAQDLYKWMQCLHSYEPITKTGLTELFESHSLSSQSTLGVGVFEDGELQYQWHHGQSDNFEASIYYNPKDDFTVALLTNNRNSNVGDLTNAIDAILRGEPFEIPKKSIEMTLRTDIFYRGFEKGIQSFDTILANRSIYDFANEEDELISTGTYLLEKDHFEDGIKMLEFTISRFPQSSAAYAALGEAYFQRGDREIAREHLEFALELNPDNSRVKELIQNL